MLIKSRKASQRHVIAEPVGKPFLVTGDKEFFLEVCVDSEEMDFFPDHDLSGKGPTGIGNLR
jgi:hypothetical protein